VSQGLICLPHPLTKRDQQLPLEARHGLQQGHEISAMKEQQVHGRLSDDRRAARLPINDRHLPYNVAGAKFSELPAIRFHSGSTVDYDDRFQPLSTLFGQNRPFAKLDLVGVLGNGAQLALAKATKQRYLSQ
jgi:hypothetical protein